MTMEADGARTIGMGTSNVPSASFVCEGCGHRAPRRLPRCPGCRAWGTVVRDLNPPPQPVTPAAPRAKAELKPLSEYKSIDVERLPTGIEGLDRVLGGGLARGCVFLVWGKPGVGKSTLLLQALSEMAERKHGKEGKRLKCGYMTAEETGEAVATRAKRLEASMLVSCISETDLPKMFAQAEHHRLDAMVIDSAQMTRDPNVAGSPGSPLQIKSLGAQVCKFAQRMNMAIVVLCQVKKDGDFAGVNFLEHVVDGGFNLFRVKGRKLVFWCPRKNRLGQATLRWKCRMDDRGKILDRVEREVDLTLPVDPEGDLDEGGAGDGSRRAAKKGAGYLRGKRRR
jgi:predicted ATP-dependent serine protease